MTQESIQEILIGMLECLSQTNRVKNLKIEITNATEESDWEKLIKDVFAVIKEAIKNTSGN